MDGPVAERSTTSRFSLGELALPVRYTDGSALACIYRVDLNEARAVIPSAAFEPLSVGGRALVQVMALEYRESSTGPYNEFGVLVLARRLGSAPSTLRAMLAPAREHDAGWYVVNLPVTTGLTCASGRELWGFPKYVTRIDTRFSRDEARIVLGDELVLEHRARFGMAMPAPTYVFFSELDGAVIRTVVPVEHRLRAGGARTVRLQVTGDGPTATTVRRLGLEKRRPMMAVRADHLRFTLPLGTPAGPVPLHIA